MKGHTKMATILFYVSGELQTHNGSQVPIDLQNDTEDYAEEDDAFESELNNQEGGGEDDTASTSSSESELNNCISQEFLQRVEGHYCSICQEQHFLTSTDLATFDTDAKCEVIYVLVQERRRLPMEFLRPQCNCIASDINHHQPIRLDDRLTYFRNTPQTLLGRSEGHCCGVCFKDFNLCDTDLGTIRAPQGARAYP